MENGWERTLPYVNIEKNIIQILLKGVLEPEQIKNITLINEGCRTTNYIIEDVFNKKFILKIFYEQNQSYKKEMELNLKLAGDIPLPKMCKFDKSHYIDNREYIIYEFIEGQTLSNYIQKGNNIKEKFLIQSADALAKLHKIEYNFIGFLDDRLNVKKKLPPLNTWYKSFLEGKSGTKIGKLLKNRILYIVNKYKNDINSIDKTSRLVHGDFQGTNILVNNSGELCGILDWEFCMAGHPIADIGQFFRYNNYSVEYIDIFEKEYNSKSTYKLPNNWYKLSKLRDMVNIIQLLNSDIDMPVKERELLYIIQRSLDILEE